MYGRLKLTERLFRSERLLGLITVISLSFPYRPAEGMPMHQAIPAPSAGRFANTTPRYSTHNATALVRSAYISTTSRATLMAGAGTTGRSAPVFTRLTSLDLTNTSVLSEIANYQSHNLLGGQLSINGGIATGGTLILTPSKISRTLTAMNVPSGVTIVFEGFSGAQAVKVSLSNLSSSKEVVLGGTEEFIDNSAANSQIIVNSNQAGTIILTQNGDNLYSTGSLTLVTNGSMELNGRVTAASNLSLKATSGSISFENPLSGGAHVTISASGKSTTQGLAGSIAALSANAQVCTGKLTLYTGGGNIGSLTGNIVTDAASLATTIKGSGSAFITDTNTTSLLSGVTIEKTSVGGEFNLTTTGSAGALSVPVAYTGSITDKGVISASSVSLTTQGLTSFIVIGKSWGNHNTKVSLTTGGYGFIADASPADKITAASVSLATNAGNIGDFTKSIPNAFSTQAKSLSIAINGQLNNASSAQALIKNHGDLILSQTSAGNGGAITLLNSGALTVAGSVTATNLTLKATKDITTNAGLTSTNGSTTVITNGKLSVNSNIAAMHGMIQLQSMNAGTGKIAIAPGAQLAASNQVEVIVGPIPQSQTDSETIPANVSVTSEGYAGSVYVHNNVFASQAGAAVQLHPNDGESIIFNTAGGKASSINLGSGCSIEAGAVFTSTAFDTIAEDHYGFIVDTGEDGGEP